MKNKTIFFNKWLSTGCLDAHLAKNLMENGGFTCFSGRGHSLLGTIILELTTASLPLIIKSRTCTMRKEHEKKSSQRNIK